MSDDIKKLLSIMSETTTSGSVAALSSPIGKSPLKRSADTIFAAESVPEDDDTGLTKTPAVDSPSNFGLWKNSAVIGAEQYGKHGRKKMKVDKTQMYPQASLKEAVEPEQEVIDATRRSRQSSERNTGLNEPDELPMSNKEVDLGTWYFTVDGVPQKKDGEIYYSSSKKHNEEVLAHLRKKAAASDDTEADIKVVQGRVKMSESRELPADMDDWTEDDWAEWDEKVKRVGKKAQEQDLQKKTESAQQCSECGGPAFSDMILAEAQDACYNKVKSRYKVWPSAYASGALVKCRKVGAANWGNSTKESVEEGVAEGFDSEYDDEAGSAETNLHTAARAIEGLIKTIEDRDNLPEWVQEKIAKAEAMLVSSWDHLLSQKEQGRDPQINESEIAESLEYVSEDLRKWFKEKWVRFGPDGKIRGDCARGSSSEGKPKCLPQSKAHSLGKKGRASSAAKKRREDPNADRSGKAKNVATKVKESTKEVAEAEQLDEEGAGLWANIRAKRARGEKMRKPGSKGAPTDADIKSIRKASNESVGDDFENDGEWAGTGATDQAAATAFAGSEASHADIEDKTSIAEAEITEEMIADRLREELALFKKGTRSKDKSIGKRPADREVQAKTPAQTKK